MADKKKDFKRDKRKDGIRKDFYETKRVRNSQKEFNLGIHQFSFYKLERMSNDYPDKLLFKLTRSKLAFEKFLMTKLTNDMLVVILRIANKFCETDSEKNDEKKKIMTIICQPYFLNQLLSYITEVTFHSDISRKKNKYFWTNPNRFWNDLIKFFDNSLILFPSACVLLSKLAKQACITLNKLDTNRKNIVSQEAQHMLQSVEKKFLQNQREKRNKNECEIDFPKEFRTIDLCPTIEEVTLQKMPYIQKNIIRGSYKSVNHYLDVQFRLLREDFIGPLRVGICSYIKQQKHEYKRLQNVYYYDEARFVKRNLLNGRFVWLVKFILPSNRKIHSTKRLMTGSLICFSSDGFKTIIFGIVTEQIDVQSEYIGIDTVESIDVTVSYIALECKVYYEPYYNVLRALQVITRDTLPLQRYIIKADTTTSHPSYLNIISQYRFYDNNFYPLLPETWPPAKVFSLDNSQLNALKSAITKELCIIQGPPGTGKTYLGLRIVELLLMNNQYWWKDKSPILVICFTNHALDQFLEGILNHTQSLIRVGGQSKNLALHQFNLRLRRMTSGISKSYSLNKLRRQMNYYLSDITSIQMRLDCLNSWNTIYEFSTFTSIEPNLEGSWFLSHSSDECLFWLLSETFKTETPRKSKIKECKLKDYSILISFKKFNARILTLRKEIDDLTNKKKSTKDINSKTEQLEKIKNIYKQFKLRMEKLKKNEVCEIPSKIDFSNPFDLTEDERWCLYHNWVNRLKEHLIINREKKNNDYLVVKKEFDEQRYLTDVNLMKSVSVVGMTTSGAAKYQNVIQALKSPIVIVEEAAEVLETHIIISLTKHCQQLILIGDHQQLRPKNSNFFLSERYNMSISLFERMINNKYPHEQLEMQHRMRPEIAQLIVPAIYPRLFNHSSVMSYPVIKGMEKNVFFLTHSHPETHDTNLCSKKNLYEAQMLVYLARYLVLQHYDPKDITIITTYAAQMFVLKEEKKVFKILQEVRIVTVDNFQGEENKIILLSLVRSNAENSIGFLNMENRICVALSRAKEGLYIIGNMKVLESNTIWQKINSVLQRNKLIGTTLILQCQNHPFNKTLVSEINDFETVSEGGCSKLCEMYLNCGHNCTSKCHIYDIEHSRYKCYEPCKRIVCEYGHSCYRACYESCGPCQEVIEITLKCNHIGMYPCCLRNSASLKCRTLVLTELKCGHKVNKPCFMLPDRFKCFYSCNIRRSCGHECDLKCHFLTDPDHLKNICYKPCMKFRKNCTMKIHKCTLLCFEACEPCDVFVKKRRSCGHIVEVLCSQDINTTQCTVSCNKKLNCGHICQDTCCVSCSDCEVMMDKVIEYCGHSINIQCSTIPSRKMCKKDCLHLLPCGHKCKNLCCDDCTTNCMELVECSVKAVCGHTFQIPCYKSSLSLEPTSIELLKYCQEQCKKILKCNHKCSGTCGECGQGRIHVVCKKKCNENLICGHPCEATCRDICASCEKECMYRCMHSKCGKKCGEPCVPCDEPCPRQCEHQKCSNICGDVCTISPCDNPCPKLLECGHNCLGFCGEICPTQCRSCQPDNESFGVLFGKEDELNSRFVYLPECQHAIEAEGLKRWLQQTIKKEVAIKRCPRCNVVIFPHRFSDFVKHAYNDITALKTHWLGSVGKNKKRKETLEVKLDVLNNSKSLLQHSSLYLSLLNRLEAEIKTLDCENSNITTICSLSCCEILEEYLKRIIDIVSQVENNKASQMKRAFEYLNFILSRIQVEDLMSEQKVLDVNHELKRFERILQLSNIEQFFQFPKVLETPENKELHEELWKRLDSIVPFTEKDDDIVKNKLQEFVECVDKSATITDIEQKLIVHSINLKEGHWFKCSNGHFNGKYCENGKITTKCNECDDAIDINQPNLLKINSCVQNCNIHNTVKTIT